MSEDDQLDDLMEDVEMASIAEEEDLDEKFSHQGMSTGKASGKKKIVSLIFPSISLSLQLLFLNRLWKISSS